MKSNYFFTFTGIILLLGFTGCSEKKNLDNTTPSQNSSTHLKTQLTTLSGKWYQLNCQRKQNCLLLKFDKNKNYSISKLNVENKKLRKFLLKGHYTTLELVRTHFETIEKKTQIKNAIFINTNKTYKKKHCYFILLLQKRKGNIQILYFKIIKSSIKIIRSLNESKKLKKEINYITFKEKKIEQQFIKETKNKKEAFKKITKIIKEYKQRELKTSKMDSKKINEKNTNSEKTTYDPNSKTSSKKTVKILHPVTIKPLPTALIYPIENYKKTILNKRNSSYDSILNSIETNLSNMKKALMKHLKNHRNNHTNFFHHDYGRFSIYQKYQKIFFNFLPKKLPENISHLKTDNTDPSCTFKPFYWNAAFANIEYFLMYLHKNTLLSSKTKDSNYIKDINKKFLRSSLIIEWIKYQLLIDNIKFNILTKLESDKKRISETKVTKKGSKKANKFVDKIISEYKKIIDSAEKDKNKIQKSFSSKDNNIMISRLPQGYLASIKSYENQYTNILSAYFRKTQKHWEKVDQTLASIEGILKVFMKGLKYTAVAIGWTLGGPSGGASTGAIFSFWNSYAFHYQEGPNKRLIYAFTDGISGLSYGTITPTQAALIEGFAEALRTLLLKAQENGWTLTKSDFITALKKGTIDGVTTFVLEKLFLKISSKYVNGSDIKAFTKEETNALKYNLKNKEFKKNLLEVLKKDLPIDVLKQKILNLK